VQRAQEHLALEQAHAGVPLRLGARQPLESLVGLAAEGEGLRDLERAAVCVLRDHLRQRAIRLGRVAERVLRDYLALLPVEQRARPAGRGERVGGPPSRRKLMASQVPAEPLDGASSMARSKAARAAF
jgi:hypothetical protein